MRTAQGGTGGVPAASEEEPALPETWSSDLVQDEDEEFLRKLASALLRRKKLVAAIFLVLCAMSLTVLAVLPTSYSSEVLVSIDQRHARVVNVESVLSNLTPDVETFQTEIQVIMSRPILKRVAEALHLQESAEYAPRNPTGFVGDIALWADGALRLLEIDKHAAAPIVSSRDPIEYAVDRLQSRLQVSQLGKSRLLRIGIESADAKLASDIVNSVAENYIGTQLQAKRDATERANTWIGERVTELQNQVAQSEAAIESFRAQAGLTKI